MPDKPKRRKNNKNKRKNKNNNRNNVNKNNSDVNDTSSVTSCDCQDESIEDACEINQFESMNDSVTTETVVENISVSQDTLANTLKDIQLSKSGGECGSKSDKTEFLSVPNATDILLQEVSNDIPTSYVVETPDVKKNSKSKLNNGMKSKSVDNDEFPVIVEITEDANVQSENETSLPVIDNSNIIITDAESDVEWEKADELLEISQPKDLTAEAFSVTTIPLEIAQCEQTKSLNAEQEESLRCYLQSLNLATSPSNLNSFEIRTEIEQIINREIKHRLRKKGLAEDMFLQRGNISRGLDVIDEEGSSESSATSRRHSYLSDKKSDNDELEDEVFENKSNVAFKPSVHSNTRSRKVIPQQCILVDAKLKEPDVSEARGDWSLKTVEKITGAEVVYLTDSSSSTSSIYDVGDDIENDEFSDASIRIITPTIEVTDTEKFLTNTFISKEKQTSKKDVSDNINDEHVIIKSDESIKLKNDTKLPEIIEKSTQHPHEIVVLSTDNITTNLTVKDVTIKSTPESNIQIKHDNISETNNEDTKLEIKSNEKHQNDTSKKDTDTYDLEIKVLKCELNDAINNLIKEVTSDTESTSDNHKDAYTRQDSSSSVCSSQCTAKYNPNYSSLNDVSNIMHEDTSTTTENNKEDSQATVVTSHVKDVFQCVSGDSTSYKNKDLSNKRDSLTLKELCVKKIASFPFGNKILVELAHVSERLQNMSILALESKGASELFKDKVIENCNSGKHQTKMPYFPLPDLSTIEKVSLSTKNQEHLPPPVQPRKSSLIKSQDEQHWTAIPTATEPVYVCLSPSQKMLMEKTNTVIRKEDASQLMDTHKKFVDRRGYNEKNNENIDTTPIVPFKSQTGSRLLALIRDPSVTNNVSLSSSQRNIFKSLESLPKLNYYENKEYSDTNTSTMSNSTKFSKSFKPIPPPRPRKFSSSFYETDESSDFTENSFRSMRSEKKHFHYSTGNLNKEIENDISSIQNMHRYYSNKRDSLIEQDYPRRPSLPKDLCDQQMEYIRRKELEVEEEIRRLEQEKIKFPEKKGPRAPLISDRSQMEKTVYSVTNAKPVKIDHIFSDIKTRKEDKGKLSSVFSKSQEELLREKMYSEYVSQMAEREHRRQQKFIKITHTPASTSSKSISKSMPMLDGLESKVNNRIEKEFISRARERWHKLGIEDPETEDEREKSNDIYREPKVIEHKIKVIQAGEETDVTKLPSHLQEFVNFTARTKEQDDIRNGESEPEKEPAHVVVFCAVIILVLAVGKFVWRLLRNKY